MNGLKKLKLFSAIFMVALVSHSESVFACAACYGGKSDSPPGRGNELGNFQSPGGGGVRPGRDCDVFCFSGKKSGNDRVPGFAGWNAGFNPKGLIYLWRKF